MVSTGDVEPAVVVNNLRQALDAIGGLSSERASLEQVCVAMAFTCLSTE